MEIRKRSSRHHWRLALILLVIAMIAAVLDWMSRTQIVDN